MELKERIQAKARELFLRLGFRSVTVDEIAKQLGISKKTLYAHFADKDELVEAVMQEEMQHMTTECNRQQVEAADAVDELVQDMVCMDQIIDTLNPVVLFDLEKYHPATYARFREHKNSYMFNIILDNLHRGQREGLFRPDMDTEVVARLRLESSFLIFNQEQFPISKFPLSRISHELNMLYLHSIVTPAGRAAMSKHISNPYQPTQTPFLQP